MHWIFGYVAKQHTGSLQAFTLELLMNDLVQSSKYWFNFQLLCYAGDYGNAIETLLTAIALIRQSKVAADDRCKVLVSSLQDCLHGIESKSYGSGSRYANTE